MKVADTINEVLQIKNIEIKQKKITEDLIIDVYTYDLIFFGTPSYQWIPPFPVQKNIKNTLNRYRTIAAPTYFA